MRSQWTFASSFFEKIVPLAQDGVHSNVAAILNLDKFQEFYKE